MALDAVTLIPGTGLDDDWDEDEIEDDELNMVRLNIIYRFRFRRGTYH